MKKINKFSALVVLMLITFSAKSQTNSCEVKISYRGDILIIQQDCEYKRPRLITEDTTNILFDKHNRYDYTHTELRLNNLARTNLSLALQKSLSWAEINKNRNFSFSKRLAEISAKSKSSGQPRPYLNKMEVVFEAKNESQYEVVIYGDFIESVRPGEIQLGAKLAFNIEDPGTPLITLRSGEEVRRFIKLIEKKSTNLNEIFK